jgi:hypothetical protein
MGGDFEVGGRNCLDRAGLETARTPNFGTGNGVPCCQWQIVAVQRKKSFNLLCLRASISVSIW